jgi:ferredoxin-NADP reductase
VKVTRDETCTTLTVRCAQGQPLPPVLPGQILSVAFGAHQGQRVQSHHYAVAPDPDVPEAYRLHGLSTTGSDESTPSGFLSSSFAIRLEPGDVVLTGAPRGGLDWSRSTLSAACFVSEGIGIAGTLACLSALEPDLLKGVRVVHHRGNEPLSRLERELEQLARTVVAPCEFVTESFLAQTVAHDFFFEASVVAFGRQPFVDAVRNCHPPDRPFRAIPCV